MDKKKHNDWTDAVRDRLEGRELKPSDALWERIDAAAPQAVAPRKVRRLAWGGAVGAAAAAVLAAVIFLRPAGDAPAPRTVTPDAGRVDVVPTPAAPLAEQRIVREPEPAAAPITAPKPDTDPVLLSTPAATVVPVTTVPTEHPEVAGQTDQAEGHVIPNEAQESMRNEKSVREGRSERTVQSTLAETEPAMTLEEFLSQDDTRRRHSSFTAAVFAAGIPSSSSFKSYDYQGLLSSDSKQAGLSYLSNNGVFVNPNGGESMASTDSNNDGNGSGEGNGGVSYNPENPQGFNPVRYSNDPYNLNGERLNHSRPVSAGLALTLPLNDHLFLESGLYYSYLHSTSYVVSNQSLHSLGIPLKLGWRLGTSSHTSLSFSAGAKAEKCILALRDGERFKEPGIQLAAVGNAAIQYDFTPRLGIFLAPELSYWFTETKLPTYNTEHPFNLSLKAGLNLTVGR